MDLCNRARRVPHLLCCICKTETDELLRRRERDVVDKRVKEKCDVFVFAFFFSQFSLLLLSAIDEIDGLAPKRDGNAAGHKVDALSVLLAVCYT